MYFYSITETDDYDNHEWTMITHEKLFSEEEFKAICEKAGEELKAKYGGYHTYDCFILANYLEKFGFKDLESNADYMI